MLKDKIKSLMNTDGDDKSKKKIENLVVLIIILIVTIMIINGIWNKNPTSSENTNSIGSKQLATETNNKTESLNNSNDNLEEKLASILKSINGVGNVNVFINYSESSVVEAMYNETTKESSTEETDTSGGVRTIQETDTQKEVIYSEDSGNKVPVTQKVTNPRIEGAIITAEGASNSNIKSNIVSAVEAVTGLASHKIQVFEMSN